MRWILCRWKDVSIRKKSYVLLGIMLLIMWVLVGMATWRLHTFSNTSNLIMQDYQQISDFLDTYSTENVWLETVIRPQRPQEALTAYEDATEKTDTCLETLLPDKEDDASSFALKRAIQNAMQHYRRDQASFLSRLLSGQDYIDQYLSLKSQSAYVDGYARDLLNRHMRGGEAQYQQMIADSTQYDRMYFVFIVFSTTLLALILVVFARSILEPLGALARAADSIRRGDYQAPPLELNGNDEVGRASRSFNLMQAKIRETIHALEKDAEIEKALRRQEAEAAKMQQALEEGRFAQLQSQINPHFLFNTLSTIAALAQEEHAPLSEDLILRLSNFFRYSLENEEKVVTLGREISLLRDYMELQETRFGDRITMKIQSDPALEGLTVPKFILQPLVENSILHGFEKKTSAGQIRVRVRRGRRGVCISVTDNGCGFSRDALPAKPGDRRSVGLHNIAERMRLSGGEMKVFSICGFGTTVKIYLNAEEADPS